MSVRVLVTGSRTWTDNTDLFGVEVPQQRPTASGQAPDRVTNDIEDVVAVLRVALRDGYAVVGVRQQVWRCLVDPVVEPVPRYEADTVRQLLDTGWLTIRRLPRLRVPVRRCHGPGGARPETRYAVAVALDHPQAPRPTREGVTAE